MPNRIALTLILPTLAALAVAAPAQAPAAGHATLGKNHYAFGNVVYKPTETVFLDGAVLTAPDYDLTAQTVDVFDAPDKSGPNSVSKIVAQADLTHGKQVIGHFRQVPGPPPAGTVPARAAADRGRYYTVYADHAVYVPDDSRPDGGTLDLTGHPKIVVRAPDSLQGPSTTTFNDPAATVHVLLGRAPDYPQVEGGAGQTDFTPLK